MNYLIYGVVFLETEKGGKSPESEDVKLRRPEQKGIEQTALCPNGAD